ncbi:MAG: polyphosphate kinase 1, partial [Treponemataceae bacterium]
MKNNFSYFNRELSWIEFNARVLSEAFDTRVPLFERLKFLGIVTSNFDEFFMVRVAGLKRQVKNNPQYKDSSGLSAKEQLSLISKRVHQLINLQYSHLHDNILADLKKNHIEYISPSHYSTQDKVFLENLFQEEIFPLLTPLRADSAEHFPHLTNLRLHAAFLLKKMFDTNELFEEFAQSNETQPLAIVQLPTSIKRIVFLPSTNNTYKFTVLDDIICTFGTKLFPGYRVEQSALFKITRDADFAVDEQREEDFIQAMEEVLEKRQSSFVVRMVCTADSPKITAILQQRLGLSEEDLYVINELIDPKTLIDITDLEGFSHLKYPAWKHFAHPDLTEDEPLWEKILQKDCMLFVPYHTYDPVIKLLNDASEDANVLAIKITLYRTSSNSPILHALEKAAKKGKQVTVFMELKARFDEKQNISWAARLERSGVIVIHGIANLKVHAKVMMIVRKELDGIQRYVHLSTGNYNEKTARLYADISLFTANTEIAHDTTMFFNMISGYS